MPATAVEVPYHYEHAPRISQGVRVEGANNWYLGAYRAATPIVVLREAPALVLDEQGRVARRDWDALPGNSWSVLGAGAVQPKKSDDISVATSATPSVAAPPVAEASAAAGEAFPPEPEWRQRKSAYDPLGPVAEK